MEDIKVRYMTIDDIPGVMEIETLSFATPWSREAFESEISRNLSARYVVAAAEQKIVGYGGMWVILDEGHITNIAVHPEHRGMGVGNMIIEAVIAAARKEKLSALTLEVRRTNLIAQNLYKKYGFIEAGVRPRYYGDNGEDAIIMWKRGIYGSAPLKLY